MAEADFEAWKEIRARVDFIANALFLVGGGALSVSIAVLLGKDARKLSEIASCLVAISWYSLLYSVVAFAFIKGILVIQAYTQYGNTSHKATWLRLTTWVNWCLGVTDMLAFVVGMLLLVKVAASAVAYAS